MHHAPLNGPGAYQGHADDNVLESAGLKFGQHLHLGTALHLKAADRVGPLQQVIDGRVVQGQAVWVQGKPLVCLDVGQGFLDRAQGAQGEEVDLDQAGIFDTVLGSS